MRSLIACLCVADHDIENQTEEVYRKNVFAPRILTLEMNLWDAVEQDTLSALAGQRVTVTCRISTGETITLPDGTIQ